MAMVITFWAALVLWVVGLSEARITAMKRSFDPPAVSRMGGGDVKTQIAGRVTRAAMLGALFIAILGCNDGALEPGDIVVGSSGSRSLPGRGELHTISGKPILTDGSLGNEVVVMELAIHLAESLNVLEVKHSGKVDPESLWIFERNIEYGYNRQEGVYKIDQRVQIHVVIDSRNDVVTINGVSRPLQRGARSKLRVEDDGAVVYEGVEVQDE